MYFFDFWFIVKIVTKYFDMSQFLSFWPKLYTLEKYAAESKTNFIFFYILKLLREISIGIDVEEKTTQRCANFQYFIK